MPKFKKSYFLILSILLVIIILSIYGYLSQKEKNELFRERIYKEFLTPYSELLSNLEFEKAYKNFTSSGYKKKYSLAKYLSAQDSNLTSYGKVIYIRTLSGIFIRELNSEKENVFKFTAIYKTVNTKKNIILELIIEDNKIKLNNSYESFLTISNITPKIY